MPRDFSETVDAVRQRVDIVDVISQRLPLKKAGRNHRGLCPFHQEKTPSFMVNGEKQIFHCFGCGAGGDVFTFLMRYENLTFYEALNELARQVGVSIPRGGGRGEDEKKRELLFHINQVAADFFHANLLSRKVGASAREYLANRGIGHETIEQYRLGYAPQGWTNLVDHFRAQSVDLEMAQSLGLIIPRKREGWYDQFRNRIIFPIVNTSGRTVGFGGGAIDDATPKYLNSAESATYKKSRSIYGIHEAGKEMRQRDLALVVEGYFDLLTLHQAGFKNAVAPLGTALTQDQVRIMKRYTRNFVLVFDSDEAGIKATFRSFDAFMAEELHPRTVRLPDGHDPDSFVRERGPEALAKAIEGAASLMEAFIDYTTERGNLKTVEGKVQVGRAILPFLKKLRDPLERKLYARSVSERLGLGEGDLFSLYEGETEGRQNRTDRTARSRQPKAYPSSERALVELMLNHQGVIPLVLGRGVIDDFESEELRQVARILGERFEKSGHVSVGEVLTRVSDEELKSRITGWVGSERFGEEDLRKAVEDCIQKVQRNRLKREKAMNTLKIKEAERTGQARLLEELLREKQELIEKERNLEEARPI